MILCVTLNPCLDKTLTVPGWSPGDNVRGTSNREVVGGKGNNVARALTRLGRWARPATFLGGPTGTRCEALMREADGFDPLVITSRAETRTILTVRTAGTNHQTAFFDPDPVVTREEADELLDRVREAMTEGVEALTLSGSSPSEATHGLFLDLITLGRSRRVPVFLDTYGPSLDSIWGFWPHVLQMNHREAGIHLSRLKPSEAEILKLLSDRARHGVKVGLVTDGPREVLAQVECHQYRVRPPVIDVVNPIGSGDCLLAGIVDAVLSGHGPEATLRRGVAAAVANALVWDAGAIELAEVERLEPQIAIEALGRVETESAAPRGAGSAFVRVGVYGRPTSRYGRR